MTKNEKFEDQHNFVSNNRKIWKSKSISHTSAALFHSAFIGAEHNAAPSVRRLSQNYNINNHQVEVKKNVKFRGRQDIGSKSLEWYEMIFDRKVGKSECQSHIKESTNVDMTKSPLSDKERNLRNNFGALRPLPTLIPAHKKGSRMWDWVKMKKTNPIRVMKNENFKGRNNIEPKIPTVELKQNEKFRPSDLSVLCYLDLLSYRYFDLRTFRTMTLRPCFHGFYHVTIRHLDISSVRNFNLWTFMSSFSAFELFGLSYFEFWAFCSMALRPSNFLPFDFRPSNFSDLSTFCHYITFCSNVILAFKVISLFDFRTCWPYFSDSVPTLIVPMLLWPLSWSLFSTSELVVHTFFPTFGHFALWYFDLWDFQVLCQFDLQTFNSLLLWPFEISVQFNFDLTTFRSSFISTFEFFNSMLFRPSKISFFVIQNSKYRSTVISTIELI